MEFINFVRDAFGMSAFELAIVGIFFVLLVIVGIAAQRFGLTELVAHRQRELQLLSDYLLSTVVLIAEGSDIDLSVYEERASQRQEDGLSYIDPRMLMLLDRADDYISGRVGFNVSFDELYARAERIYQEYRKSQR